MPSAAEAPTPTTTTEEHAREPLPQPADHALAELATTADLFSATDG